MEIASLIKLDYTEKKIQIWFQNRRMRQNRLLVEKNFSLSWTISAQQLTTLTTTVLSVASIDVFIYGASGETHDKRSRLYLGMPIKLAIH